MVAKGKNLALAAISLDFESQVKWDLIALVDDIVDWLNDPMISKTSKVGTLSSPHFLDLVRPCLQETTGTTFQRMMYAISLAYTQPTAPDRHHLSISELHQIGSIAGHDILNILEEKLRPQSLKKCSGDDLRVLFLLVVGTILAVGYTELPATRTEINQLDQFKAMQNHLCQILAHYVIYLGSQLKLPIANGADQFILEAAPARWHKEGIFQWKTARVSDFDSDQNINSDLFVHEELLKDFFDKPLTASLLKDFDYGFSPTMYLSSCSFSKTDACSLPVHNFLSGAESLTEEQAMKIIEENPTISLLEIDAPIAVCGDVHGGYYDLMNQFKFGIDLGGTPYDFLREDYLPSKSMPGARVSEESSPQIFEDSTWICRMGVGNDFMEGLPTFQDYHNSKTAPHALGNVSHGPAHTALELRCNYCDLEPGEWCIHRGNSSGTGQLSKTLSVGKLFHDTNLRRAETEAETDKLPSYRCDVGLDDIGSIQTTTVEQHLPRWTTSHFQIPAVNKKRQRRRGTLSKDEQAAAQAARENNTCWACRISRSKCSPGEQCSKHQAPEVDSNVVKEKKQNKYVGSTTASGTELL